MVAHNDQLPQSSPYACIKKKFREVGRYTPPTIKPKRKNLFTKIWEPSWPRAAPGVTRRSVLPNENHANFSGEHERRFRPEGNDCSQAPALLRGAGKGQAGGRQQSAHKEACGKNSTSQKESSTRRGRKGRWHFFRTARKKHHSLENAENRSTPSLRPKLEGSHFFAKAHCTTDRIDTGSRV